MKKILFLTALALCLLLNPSCRPEKDANRIGIWLWSKYMTEIDLDEMAHKDIKNVILHEVSFEKHGIDSTLAFIKEAQGKDIKVHIWFQCFYSGGQWINPVDDENNRYKQEYFDEVISRAMQYVGYGVDGIHLDYIRFGGTAWKHNPSEEITAVGCVTEFCRQLNKAVKAANPNVILSAALMPEPYSEELYGQDPALMGQYMDVLMPMIYFRSGYNRKEAAWPVKVADYFAEKGAPAEVWAGITTYTANPDDTGVSPMSEDEILRDARIFKKSKAKGVVLFRYGLGTMPDMHFWNDDETDNTAK